MMLLNSVQVWPTVQLGRLFLLCYTVDILLPGKFFQIGVKNQPYAKENWLVYISSPRIVSRIRNIKLFPVIRRPNAYLLPFEWQALTCFVHQYPENKQTTDMLYELKCFCGNT